MDTVRVCGSLGVEVGSETGGMCATPDWGVCDGHAEGMRLGWYGE